MSSPDYDSILKFVSGGLAGMIAKTAVAPIDRVKFLFMGTIRNFTAITMKSELKRIFIEEGMRSFWKGNLAQLIRVFPYSGTVRNI